jgi:hypothetical protein
MDAGSNLGNVTVRAVQQAARTELRQALVRVTHLQIGTGRYILPQERQLEAYQHLEAMLDLFEFKSSWEIRWCPSSMILPPVTPAFNKINNLKGEEEGDFSGEEIKEQFKETSPTFDSVAPLMYQGTCATHLSLLKENFTPCEIGRSQLAAELLSVIFRHVGRRVGKGKMNLKPAMMGRIHEYCQEIVTMFIWDPRIKEEEGMPPFKLRKSRKRRFKGESQSE